MKKYVTFLVALLLLTALASCSGPSETSEADILSDIQNEDLFFQEYGLTIDSSTITKRQTNEADKTDYVWVDVTASNSDFTYSASYELMYVLYNDGWLLEDYDKSNNSRYSVNYVCDEAIPEAQMRSSFSDFSLVNIGALNDNTVTFSYRAMQRQNEYRSVEYTVDVICVYSPSTSWQVEEIYKRDIGEFWDICGTYTYNDAITSLTVEIVEFDAEDLTATISYSLISYEDSEKTNRWMEQDRQFTSNGYIDIKLENQYQDEATYQHVISRQDQRFPQYTIDYAEIYFCGEPSTFVDTIEGTGGAGMGVMVSLATEYSFDQCYWLERQ